MGFGPAEHGNYCPNAARISQLSHDLAATRERLEKLERYIENEILPKLEDREGGTQ